MTNLTADQIEAIDFFAANEQHVQYFGLTNLDREDRLVYRKGKKLMQSILDMKNRNAKGYVKWTDTEYAALASAYIKYAPSIDTIDRNAIIDEVCSQFPNTRTKNSVLMYIQICVRIDNKMPSKEGLANPAEGLVLALQDIDADRFTEYSFDDKLNALVVEICA